MRTRQLQRRDNALEETTLHLQRIRFEGKERHDLKHGFCNEELAIGSIILLHDTRCKKVMFCKLSFKWLEPYQICDILKNKSMYILKELDGSRLVDTFAGDRFKELHLRQQLQLDHASNLDHEEIPTLDDFLAGDRNSELSNALNYYS